MHTASADHAIRTRGTLWAFNRYFGVFTHNKLRIYQPKGRKGSIFTHASNRFHVTEFVWRAKDRTQTINAFRTAFMLENLHDRLTL